MRRLTTPMEQDLVLSVAQGSDDALMLIFTMRNICGVAERTDYLLYLKWLEEQNIKGQDFVRWWSIKHNNSGLNAIAYLRQQVYKDTKKRALYSKVRL